MVQMRTGCLRLWVWTPVKPPYRSASGEDEALFGFVGVVYAAIHISSDRRELERLESPTRRVSNIRTFTCR